VAFSFGGLNKWQMPADYNVTEEVVPERKVSRISLLKGNLVRDVPINVPASGDDTSFVKVNSNTRRAGIASHFDGDESSGATDFKKH
jgi:hypothetical protein